MYSIRKISQNYYKTIENTIDYNKELIIRSIKIIDIFFSTFIYILFAFVVSLFLDKYVFPKFDEEKEKNKYFIVTILELCAIIGFTGIISYIFRNLIQLIPFPLEGIYGFRHMQVYEVKSGALFSAYIILLNGYLQKKIVLIKQRFSNITKKN